MTEFKRKTIRELVAEVLAEDLPQPKREGPLHVRSASAMKTWKPASVLPRASVQTVDGLLTVTFNRPHQYTQALQDRALELARQAAEHRPMDALDDAFRLDADTSIVLTYLLSRHDEWFTDGFDPAREEELTTAFVNELFA